MASKALIYGLQQYTDVWARVKRGYKGYELIPASHLDHLASDLSKFPKVKVVAVACWAEIICSNVDRLHVSESLSPIVSEAYSSLMQLSKDSSIRVS